MTEKTLNSQQLKAIKHKKGPLLIVAGAGTGKTTVITERIKYLISRKKVRPDNVLALTFTEKAAREMQERLDIAMPMGYEEPWIMTFHSFCDRILRDEGLEIGLSTDYKILDQPNQWILVKKHLFSFGLKYYLPLGNPNKFIGALLKFISRAQDEDITENNFKLQISNDKFESNEKTRFLELAQAYSKYQEIKLKENFLDFGDLITWTLRLFRERPAILRKYRAQFRHILIDEFQDTNWAQLQLIKLLASVRGSPNLVVVGDDDQAVYRWRGAAVSNILDFKMHYPKAGEVVLSRNYRSGQKLLDTAYKLIINNNPDRLEVRLGIDKKLQAARGAKLPLPEICQLKTLEDEADFVAAKITDLVSRENYTYKDFVILARANNHLDPFVAALKRSAIPYQLIGNRGLFDTPEVKDLIFFARSVVTPQDSINLYQVLNNNVFKVKSDKILDALSRSRTKRVSLWEIIQADENLKFAIARISEARLHVSQYSVSRILYEFIRDTEYVKQFVETETVENQLKLKNLNLFFQKIKKFEAENKSARLPEFIDWLDLLIEAGDNPAQAQIEDIDTVVLGTVHSVKGLEFSVVFVVNCVADRFPTRVRSDAIEFPEELIKESLPEGNSHLEEERRLFYVACTRARDYLFLTLAKDYGGAREKRPSVFLQEIQLSFSKIDSESRQLSWLTGLAPVVSKPGKVTGGRFQPSHISFSQLDTFITCPLKYKYKNILNIPAPPHHALTFGSSIHATLRDFHGLEKKGLPLDKTTLLDLYQKHFDPNGYDSESHKIRRFEAGRKFLENYFAVHKQQFPGKPHLLEQYFRIPIGDIPLTGKIDRIDKISNNYELIDYKTGSVKDQKFVDKDKQLTIYAMAAKWYFHINTEQMSLYFIEENKKISTLRSDESLLEELDKIKATITEMKKSDFPAKPGYPFPCHFCDYKLICPFAKRS